jgi:hypothetical protein
MKRSAITRLLVLLLGVGLILPATAQTSKEDLAAKRERRATKTGSSRTRHGLEKHAHARAVVPLPGDRAPDKKESAELAQIERQGSRTHVQRSRSPKAGTRPPLLARKDTAKNSEMNFQYHPPKGSSGGKGGGRRTRQSSGGRAAGVKFH